jgi:glycosyltransferase involved in cell wall biosynthesis
MISIIICSRDAASLERVKQNIAATIGVVYEVIAIANHEGKMGICKAYNLGAASAKFDVLCFMHEDVSFESQGWGIKLIHHLSDPSVGLIGIAGGDTKSLVPSSWASFIFPSEITIFQHFRLIPGKAERIQRTGYPEDKSTIKKVAAIDGVFMCTRKDVFTNYQYDEMRFPAFHGYDIDFSIQVGQSYAVCVVSDILLHHYSEGSFNKEWLEASIEVSNKWFHRLPVSVRELNNEKYIHQHWTSMRNFIRKLIELNYGLFSILPLYFRFSFTKYFHLKHFLHFLRIILLVRLFNSKTAFAKLSPE